MSLEVRTGAGTGFELLVAAAAVADADWRRIFTHGETAYTAVRRRDRALVPAVRRFGRFGWINLAGLLAGSPAPWTRRRLTRLVAATPPDDLLTALVGGRRQQLRTRVDDQTLRSAVAGDAAAVPRLRAAVADTLLQISPWLLRTEPHEVKAVCLHLLESLPVLDTRAPATADIARSLEREGGARLLERVAPGIHYAPGYLDRVTLVTSVRTAPILVSVDEVGHTVILHPPLTEEGTSDASAQLRALGRAVGDDTRIRVLQELRGQARTLAELCAALHTPRTTLLHHLALLRSAGLVDLDVKAGDPNVYTLDERGFETLASAARGFTTQ